MERTILVTGGAGFIGSNLVKYLINETDFNVVNVDKLTYAGNLISLKDISENSRYGFEQVDVCDKEGISRVLKTYKPQYIMHLAAESHVDRSIAGSAEFIQTNIFGTYNLLECALAYYRDLDNEEKKEFRFLHVSTDEVFGSLMDEGFFTEDTAYDPRSPYSASKASSDHLVRAWYHTYDLPTLITNCSNNYGPFQYPEKLIPVVILNAINDKPIPVYGKGANVRDWLYVEDHIKALYTVVTTGKIGETYNIGGNNEKTNLELVNIICSILDIVKPRNKGSYKELISFVKDRSGHDYRYAIDATKLKNQLGFNLSVGFNEGIKKTVEWYMLNSEWCGQVSKSISI